MINLIKKDNIGWIELITGCMFAGKTEEFIRRINRLSYGKYKIKVFKPIIDDRYSKDHIVSHSNMRIEAINVKNSKDILDLANGAQVIGIDEVQFFDEDIVSVLNTLANRKKIVVASGLDKNYLGDPFSNTRDLMSSADYVTKIHAICLICGSLASFTQRVRDNKPVDRGEPVILIGSTDTYEARCRSCYVWK